MAAKEVPRVLASIERPKGDILEDRQKVLGQSVLEPGEFNGIAIRRTHQVRSVGASFIYQVLRPAQQAPKGSVYVAPAESRSPNGLPYLTDYGIVLPLLSDGEENFLRLRKLR